MNEFEYNDIQARLRDHLQKSHGYIGNKKEVDQMTLYSWIVCPIQKFGNSRSYDPSTTDRMPPTNIVYLKGDR